MRSRIWDSVSARFGVFDLLDKLPKAHLARVQLGLKLRRIATGAALEDSGSS
jgi:hypothetical protein